jgi:hypothetical protein
MAQEPVSTVVPEPAPERRSWARLLLAACSLLLALVAIDLVSRRVVAPLTCRHSVQAIDDMRHALVASSRRQPVAVLCLGSSHTLRAVVPSVVERRLGLPRGAVVNTGITSISIHEMHDLWAGAREAGVRAPRVALVEVGLLQFNRNLDPRMDAWRARAGLQDRLHVAVSVAVRADLALGACWSLWDLRHTWRELPSVFLRRELHRWGMDPDPQLFDEDGWPLVEVPQGRVTLAGLRRSLASLRHPGTARPQPALNRDRLPASEESLKRSAREAFLRHLDAFMLDERAVLETVDLVRTLAADGATVLLAEYPVSEPYRQMVAEKRAAEDRAWREALARELPDHEVWEVAQAVGDSVKGCFWDADHVTFPGAIAVSKAIADRLAALPMH